MTHYHLSPHDRFIRSMMSDQLVAREFFEQHLPENIKKLVHLDTLKPQSDSFVDEDLKMKMVDLLYQVQFGAKKGYLFLLLEHQSKPDRWMAFRLLKYSLAIMEKHLKETHTKELPVIYPMVLYNGRRKYPYSTDLFALFGENKKLAHDTLFAPFHLIDLSQIPDTQLEEYFWSGVLTRTMKHIYERDPLPFLKKALIKDLQIIEKIGKEDYIVLIITYLAVAGDIKDSREFLNVLENGLSEKTREGIMTVAEQLRQEGWQKGRVVGITEGEVRGEARGKVEGKIEALRTMALKLLKEGMSIDRVAKLTELSKDDIEKIE